MPRGIKSLEVQTFPQVLYSNEMFAPWEIWSLLGLDKSEVKMNLGWLYIWWCYEVEICFLFK